jgi:hypothetical protein
MGLDLTLISISNNAKFVLDKAKQNIKYAIDLDKIQDTELLKLHLKMVQANPDGTPEGLLQELIEDSEKVLSYYPNKKIENYIFCSRTRGYDTLNYLLTHHLKDKQSNITPGDTKIFYGGTDIECSSQLPRFQYLDNVRTAEICDLLEPIDFSSLLEYYDYKVMETLVYKLTKPENIIHLEEEFEQLKTFYKEAKTLGAFVLIRVV